MDAYFKAYEDLEVHRLMLEDVHRTNSYREAILNAPELFKDKVVMDIGAGTGILSLFCAKAGAKKVYAVEASCLAEYLPKVISANNFTSDTIEVIHGKIEDITLDVKVDILVSEWMGFYLLHESMLDSVLFARDKFLKSNGLMFPNKASLFAAPCQVNEIWNTRRQYWLQPKYEFDLSPLMELASQHSTPEIAFIPTDGLLSDPQLLWELNLQTIDRTELKSFSDRRFFSIEKQGEFHGVGFWFTCTFPLADDTEEQIELSTAPWDEETHWKQTIVLLPSLGETLEEGDILGWEIKLDKGHDARSYSIEITIAGNDEPHPIPCDCGTAKCEIIKHYLSTKNSEAGGGGDDDKNGGEENIR